MGKGILIAIFLIVALVIVLVFAFWSKHFSNKSEEYADKTSITYSTGYIDIETKKIFIKEFRRNKKQKNSLYDLETFIYSMSINANSKDFRELLKLINNNSNVDRIKKKLSEVSDNFHFIIDYTIKRRTLVFASINPEEEFDGKIHFQLMNNELTRNLSKSHFQKDMLDNGLIPLTDTEIYNRLVKTSKNFLTKGITMVKISSIYPFLSSEKDYILNAVHLVTLQKELLKEEIQTIPSKDGSLYFILKYDGKRNFENSNRYWKTRINGVFSKIKRNEYLDANLRNYNVDTFIASLKDSKTINEGLLYLNLATEYRKRNEKFDYEDLIFEAKSINVSAQEIIKSLKEKNPPIGIDKISIVERGIKEIVEIYIDYPEEIITPIVKFSFRHKRELQMLLISLANKVAAKNKEDIHAILIDIFSIGEVKNLLEDEKIRPNLYMLVKETGKHTYFKRQLVEYISILKEKEINRIQFVKDKNGCSLELYNILEPAYVLISRGVGDEMLLSDNFNINLNMIINNKDKSTKIINEK